MILNAKLLDTVVSQLTQFIPSGLTTMSEDLQKNFKAVLQNLFAKLDFVPRDEFDAQMEVLHRTREKLESLEKDLLTLEQLLQNKA